MCHYLLNILRIIFENRRILRQKKHFRKKSFEIKRVVTKRIETKLR